MSLNGAVERVVTGLREAGFLGLRLARVVHDQRREHDGRVVVQTQRTITTSDGFQGRGTDTFVDNGKIQRFTLNDMLSHESGARIRAHFVQVIDLSTTPPTVRVFKGTFDGTICVGA